MFVDTLSPQEAKTVSGLAAAAHDGRRECTNCFPGSVCLLQHVHFAAAAHDALWCLAVIDVQCCVLHKVSVICASVFLTVALLSCRHTSIVGWMYCFQMLPDDPYL